MKRFPSAIAVGDYADDLHHCHDESDFEAGLDSKADDPPRFRSGPFQVPFGVLIPEDVEGMLAAEKNIAVSRLANGATRLQPITMLTGEAAGALAALSVRQGVPARRIDWEQLQVVLLEAGSILANPPMLDVAQGTLGWQAAQLAVTHEWMETRKENKFHPEETLDRADAAAILSAAYALAPSMGVFGPTPNRLTSSFVDVPLYSASSTPVEALKQAGVAPICKGDQSRFCPADPMTRTEFVRIVQELEAKRSDVTTKTLWGNMRPDGDVGITRGDAAIVLYAAVRARVTKR